MAIEALIAKLERRRSIPAETPVTAAADPDVPVKSPPMLGCTAVTSVTAEMKLTASQCVAVACVRASLPADAVLAQFDHWQYGAADLAEIAAWDDATLEAHARLLFSEMLEAGARATTQHR
ncbi:hypothetical protein [Nevskia sp.]|uniref:hypothetical protein n=1 Tax=Nevskia sp. TaxID=1929292 RepID=UPI0025E6E289|nr:hypothetical protein [Nevskia sp.]